MCVSVLVMPHSNIVMGHYASCIVHEAVTEFQTDPVAPPTLHPLLCGTPGQNLESLR